MLILIIILHYETLDVILNPFLALLGPRVDLVSGFRIHALLRRSRRKPRHQMGEGVSIESVPLEYFAVLAVGILYVDAAG